MDSPKTASAHTKIILSTTASPPRRMSSGVIPGWVNADTAGTITLSSEGRVTLTLLTGRLVFSAPVSCIRYKSRLTPWTNDDYLVLVVGNQLYKLGFYKTDAQPMGNRLQIMSGRAENRASIVRWQEAFDTHASIPADAQPIIATELYAGVPQSKYAAHTGTALFTSLFLIVIPIGLNLTSPIWLAIILLACIVCIAACIALIIQVLTNEQQRLAAFTELPKDIATKPEDVLPAGTPANPRIKLA